MPVNQSGLCVSCEPGHCGDVTARVSCEKPTEKTVRYDRTLKRLQTFDVSHRGLCFQLLTGKGESSAGGRVLTLEAELPEFNSQN